MVAVGLAVYLQAAGFSFLDYDDPLMVVENEVVQQGLSKESLSYALTDTTMNLWHPLTWLSHMADVELFGKWAGGPHLVNVLLHLANSLLVLWLLTFLTGRVIPGAAVALLFAVHPMHVESVVWISERKDVLSAFFYLLTVLLYAHWVRTKRWPLYAAAVVACLGGFLSKPSLITLPFALLLVDFWPLGRIEWKSFSVSSAQLATRCLEKGPFFLMAAVFAAVAWRVQASGSHAGVAELISLPERLAVTILGYLSYFAHTFWPSGLAPFYPHPDTLDPVLIVWGGGILLGGSLAALALHKRAPFLLFGWFWFVGLLFPASGIVTISDAFAPDRYSYLAHVGLFVAVVWGGQALAVWIQLPRAVPATAGAAAVVVLGLLATVQSARWKTSEALWTHAVEVTEGNYFAHNKLAVLRLEEGRDEEGIRHLRRSVAAKPDFAFAHANLGRVLGKRGEFESAIHHFERAIAVKPADLAMRRAIVALLQEGDRAEEALSHLQVITRKDAGDARAHYDLGTLLQRSQEPEGALRHLRIAANLTPDTNFLVRGDLGALLVQCGEFREALAPLQAAARQTDNPHRDRAFYLLGLAHHKLGEHAAARRDLESALKANPSLEAARLALKKLTGSPPGSSGVRSALTADHPPRRLP